MKNLYIIFFLFTFNIAKAFHQGYNFNYFDFEALSYLDCVDRMDFAGYMGRPIVYIEEDAAGFTAWAYCYIENSENSGLKVKIVFAHFDDSNGRATKINFYNSHAKTE